MADTPFGKMQSDEGLKRAPTKPEVAANPGLYDGTPQDPLNGNMVRQAVMAYSTVAQNAETASGEGRDATSWTGGDFADFFKFDQKAALAWFRDTYDGHPLNLDKLSPHQRSRLGLK